MSKNEKLTPHLYELSDILEENKTLISINWISVETVKAVFDGRKISIKKFRVGYGIPIIEYFISVVKEEKDAGNCPIMSKLVNYLISKNITPREVFDICIGFRGSLIIFLLKQEIVLKNPIPFMKEVASIFDANLSGVMEIFTNLYADAQKKIETAKAQKTKLQQTLKIINFINTKIIIVQSGRIILANRPFLEMLGVDDLKSLYIKYKKGFEYISEIDTFEHDFKVNTTKWINRIYKNNKAFQCEIYNEKMNKIFKYSGRITNIPDEDIDQYIITFSNISDHIRDEKALQDLLTHDEITGFKNYPTFEKLIIKMIKESKDKKHRLFLAIADIPVLREINEKEGTNKGDMVISEVAEDLRLLVNKDIYFGRLAGSKFGILMQYPTEQASYDWCVKLFQKMNEREYKKTLAITEVDLSESVNKLFLRAYSLIEDLNNCDDILVGTDFKNIIKYKELPEQQEFINRITKLKLLDITLFYSELPVASEAKILATNNDNVKISLSSKQCKVAKPDMPIYFKLEQIGNIKAYIKDIDENKKIATINRFRFDKHSPLSRNIYRVAADKNIKAYITDNNRDYDVKILNMNRKFIAIEIDRKRNLDINSFIFIDMMLPVSDISVSCSTNATITRINKVANGYVMVLLCHFNDEEKDILTKYISKHQMDIIQNIKR